MGLGAPALLLLGVHEFAGTPISKGYETGFEWHADRITGSYSTRTLKAT